MSIFIKHKDLPNYLETTYLGVALSTQFGVISQNSNINIKNSTISNIAPFFNINNSHTNVVSSNIIHPTDRKSSSRTIKGKIYKSIPLMYNTAIMENSTVYVDGGQQWLNNGNNGTYDWKYYWDDNYTEKGSLFAYTMPSYLPLSTITVNSLQQKERELEISHSWSDTTIGTGNQFWSTHFLTNQFVGYWGNTYAGEVTTNSTENKETDEENHIIVISSLEDKLPLLLSNLPRNLNGYKLIIKVTRNLFEEVIPFKNFYNGTLKVIFTQPLKLDTENLLFSLENNTAQLELVFKQSIKNVIFELNDNSNVNFTFDEKIRSFNINGRNNVANLTFNNFVLANESRKAYEKDVALENKEEYVDDSEPDSIINYSNNFFSNNSYNNKIIVNSKLIDENSSTETTGSNSSLLESLLGTNVTTNNEVTLTDVAETLIASVTNNKKINGNYIVFSNEENKISQLVNDGYNAKRNNNLIIDDVQLNATRDVTDVGTIIGWPANLPIPRGYYECNGQTVAVDIHNPEDQFYNGQLAWYMNKNLQQKTIQLPNIPTTVPVAKAVNGANNFSMNFTPVNNKEKLIYIIKYNNNFENRKKGT